MSTDDQQPDATETDERKPDVSTTATKSTESEVRSAKSETPQRSVRVVENAAASVPGGRNLVIALAVALVAAFALAAWFGLSWRGDHKDLATERDLAAAGVSAEDAARKMITDMTTYSYREKEFAWLDDYLLPAAAAEYQDQAALVLQFVQEQKFVVEGEVIEIAHRVVSEDKVVVMAFVDQTFKRQGSKRAEGFEEQRTRLTLVRKGDTWKVERMDPMSGDNAVR